MLHSFGRSQAYRGLASKTWLLNDPFPLLVRFELEDAGSDMWAELKGSQP